MSVNMFEKPIAANPMSQFQALPLQFMAQAVQTKQARFDSAQGEMEESEGLLGKLQALQGDSPRLQEIRKQYDDEVDLMVSEVGGDLSQVTGRLDRFKRKLKRDMEYGELSAINANYLKGMKQYGDIEKGYSKGDYSLGGFNIAKQALASHKTTEREDGTYSSFQGYNPSNISDPTQFMYDKVDEIVAQYDSEGRKLRGADDIMSVLGTSLETMPDLGKALAEAYSVNPRQYKDKDGKIQTETLEEFGARTMETIVKAKGYQEVLKQTEGGQGGGFAVGTVSRDWGMPERVAGVNEYTGGTVPGLREAGKWLGFNTTKEHDDFVSSAEGKRMIKYLNKNASSDFPTTGSYSEQSAWLEENTESHKTANITAGKSTPEMLKRGIDQQGFLNSTNAIYDKSGRLLKGPEAKAIQGTDKDTGQKAKIVGIVGNNGGGGYYPMGSYMILGSDGNEYIQEVSDPEILGSTEFNLEQINTALTAKTGKTNVTLQGDIKSADGSVGIPRGAYTVTARGDDNDTLILSQNGVPKYIKTWVKKPGGGRKLVIKKTNNDE